MSLATDIQEWGLSKSPSVMAWMEFSQRAMALEHEVQAAGLAAMQAEAEAKLWRERFERETQLVDGLRAQVQRLAEAD